MHSKYAPPPIESERASPQIPPTTTITTQRQLIANLKHLTWPAKCLLLLLLLCCRLNLNTVLITTRGFKGRLNAFKTSGWLTK